VTFFLALILKFFARWACVAIGSRELVIIGCTSVSYFFIVQVPTELFKSLAKMSSAASNEKKKEKEKVGFCSF